MTTVVTPGADDAASSPGDPSHPAQLHLRASTVALRQTTRWIITAAAALASVILAGLRFSEIAELDPGTGRFAMAIGATVVALASVGWVVRSASDVLLIRYSTLREVLLAIELTRRRAPLRGRILRKMKRLARRPSASPAMLVRALESERTYLLGATAHSLSDLWAKLRDAASSVPDTPLEAAPELYHAAQRVVEFADHWTAHQHYRQLLWTLVPSGLALIAALGTFASAVGGRPEEPPPLATPIGVTVHFTSAGLRELPSASRCTENQRDGFVVAGPLTGPAVVLEETANCPAASIARLSEDVGVAVPRVELQR